MSITSAAPTGADEAVVRRSGSVRRIWTLLYALLFFLAFEATSRNGSRPQTGGSRF